MAQRLRSDLADLVLCNDMRKRILLVDDETSLLYAIEAYLGGCGYEVHCATEVEQAIALLTNIRYDLVLTDLRMTPIQGAEGLLVLQVIRDHGLQSRVIVLTGAATPAVESEAKRLGVDRFLLKPLPLPTLAGIVADLTA